MKRQIRYGMWESNSSSSHVIVVTKNDHILTQDDIATSYKDYQEDELKEYIYINKKGEWDVYGELYFGRGFKVMSSLEDKVEYAIAEYCGKYSDYTDEEKSQKLNEIQSILASVIPGLTGIDIPKEYEDAYEDLEGNELDPDDVLENWEVNRQSAMRHFYIRDGKKHPAKLCGSWETLRIGGIDHQSMGLLPQFLITEGITLKDFLLNKKYVVVEDSDELNYFDELKQSGLFNKDNIVKEYTAWQAYQDSKKIDPELKEWLDEQGYLKEEDDDEETN